MEQKDHDSKFIQKNLKMQRFLENEKIRDIFHAVYLLLSISICRKLRITSISSAEKNEQRRR